MLGTQILENEPENILQGFLPNWHNIFSKLHPKEETYQKLWQTGIRKKKFGNDGVVVGLSEPLLITKQ